MNEAERPDARGRFAGLDIARTLALLGMAVFHFSYDLELFGHLPPGTTVSGGWAVFARLVAGSFLFLAGVSLWLAHGNGVRPRAFLRRLAVIAAAALLISVVTRIALPGRFIYFGILHSIASASVIGLLALRLPAFVTLAAAASVVAVARLGPFAALDAPILWPLGLSENAAASVDFVPLFPWLAPFLAGIALARIALPAMSGRRGAPSRMIEVLSWPGRHSLLVYLVHQPVLVGLVWAGTRLFG